jgi:hypothetical protein
MHREIPHADEAFQHESRSALYLFTALLGVLLLADLWPWFAGGLDSLGLSLPAWPNEVGGYRIAQLVTMR